MAIANAAPLCKVLFLPLLLAATALHIQSATADVSLERIKEQGNIVVGSDVPYGVMEFYDDDNNLVGIDIDIVDEISQQMGVSFEVKNIPFNRLFDSLKTSEVDIVVSAVTITPERQETMLFSVPYMDAGMSIAVHENNIDIKSASDLEGKRIGVLKGTVGEKLVADSDDFGAAQVVAYEKNDERLEALVDGDLDAIIVHFLTANTPSVKLVGEPLTQSFYGIVAKMNDRAFMDEINRILRRMKRTGRLDEIKQKYVQPGT